MDELKIIREYLEDIPKIKDKVNRIEIKVDEVNDRLIVVEHIVRDHEHEIRQLKAKVA